MMFQKHDQVVFREHQGEGKPKSQFERFGTVATKTLQTFSNTISLP
jgi:hypothetical protein